MLPRRVLAPDSAHHGALPYGCYASVEGGQEGECWRGTTVLGPSFHQIVHTTGHVRVGTAQVSTGGGKRGCAAGVPQS